MAQLQLAFDEQLGFLIQKPMSPTIKAKPTPGAYLQRLPMILDKVEVLRWVIP
ncbi:MAG TPA: hypothetical protein PLI96_01665 [Halothiobacillus sp.]|uniref:hypothetical protein n=1 Tax=Halothiobacillus sp. 15-55-196 TaxID=1970382 RepID=UPI0025C2F2C1|nr:hypothetical protein [Halothiobacillus sp. 15-55-196]HUM99177.1 hypothetical protein [Halothiobacillus sp.]